MYAYPIVVWLLLMALVVSPAIPHPQPNPIDKQQEQIPKTLKIKSKAQKAMQDFLQFCSCSWIGKKQKSSISVMPSVTRILSEQVQATPSITTSHSLATPGAFQSLPAELRDALFSQLNSIQDVAKCRLVCKGWSEMVEQHVLDVKKYSSTQSLFRQLLDGSTTETRPTIKRTLDVLDKTLATQTMCSVPLGYWLTLQAKYGRIPSLERWFQNEKEKDHQDLVTRFMQVDIDFRTSVNIFQRLAFEPTEAAIVWFVDKLQELKAFESKPDLLNQKENIVLQLVRLAIEKNYPRVLNHPYLSKEIQARYLPLRPETAGYLWTIMHGHNRTLFEEWMQMYPRFHHHLFAHKDMPVCTLCNEKDFDIMIKQSLQEDPEKSLDSVIRLAVIGAAEIGNHKQILRLLKLHPNPKISRVNWSDDMEKGLFHLIKKLGSVDSSFANMRPFSILKLPEFIKYIQSLDQLGQQDAEDLNLHLPRIMCGSNDDIAALKKLHHLGFSFNGFWMDKVLRQRHDFFGFYGATQFQRQSILQTRTFCRYNETLNLVQFLLKQVKIKPSQTTLQLAVALGRLDILKLVYEQGNALGAQFVFDSNFIHSWQKSWEDRFHWVHSLQEPAVIDYMLEKVAEEHPQDSRAQRDFLVELRQFLKAFNEETRNYPFAAYNCFESHVDAIFWSYQK